MDFNELRQLQIDERSSSIPQKINEEFYEEIEQLLSEQEHPLMVRSVNVIKKNIKRLRFNKIINYAKQMAESNTEQGLPNLTTKETEFYKDCVELFRGWYQ